MSVVPSIHAPSEQESELADSLRAACVAEIERRDEDAVCELLGLAQHGLRRLIWQSRWDLTLAFRVAERLGLPVTRTIVESVERPAGERQTA